MQTNNVRKALPNPGFDYEAHDLGHIAIQVKNISAPAEHITVRIGGAT